MEDIIVEDFTRYEDGSLKGFCTIVFFGVVKVNGCRLLEGKDGDLWVAMPSKKGQGKDRDKYFAIVYIDDEDMRYDINDAVIEAYEKSPSTSSRGRSNRNTNRSSSRRGNNDSYRGGSRASRTRSRRN